MSKVLEFSDVSKKYGSLTVLVDTSLVVKENEIVCLLGPSGSGKTTLFKIAGGLLTPDKGKVEIMSGIRTSYVFQEPRLLPWKTIGENLRLIQQNYLDIQQAEKLRTKLLSLVGLEDIKHSYPAELSGGMKQRIEIIKALSIHPGLLLMDEPFKSVDTRTRVNLRQMILRLQKEWKFSIFLITHDPEEAVLLADRIYVLSDKPGQIIKEFKIDQPQFKRTLKDDEIYGMMEEIIDIFVKLVDEFCWRDFDFT